MWAFIGLVLSLAPFALAWWLGNQNRNKLRDDDQNLG